MDASEFQTKMDQLSQQLDAVKQGMAQLAAQGSEAISLAAYQAPVVIHSGNFIIDAFLVLMLACFVGYYVVWNVTPALHAPLMGITNAISSVIIVGAIIAAGPELSGFSKWLGFAGIVFASINIFGGFVVTNRMLEMFTSKKKK